MYHNSLSINFLHNKLGIAPYFLRTKFVPRSYQVRSFPVAIEAKEVRSKYVHDRIKNTYK